MATKKRMTYAYADAAGNRHTISVTEAKFGWTVVIKENGIEKRRSNEMGALMTVMSDAMVGHPR